MHISTFPFSKAGRDVLTSTEAKATDWPVVYLINNDKELYIGETQNAAVRFEQHLINPLRKGLKTISIVFDSEFNKSAILDVEQHLIQLCTADHKFKLQNVQPGQSIKHDYYQREKYLNKIDDIWQELKKRKLVQFDIDDLRNSNLFKYSPYNTLTLEQAGVCKEIIDDACARLDRGEEGTAIINGGAGTGKTIVLINLLYRFVSAMKIKVDPSEEDEDLKDYTDIVMKIQRALKHNHGKPFKIAYICPMTSLRKTMKTVFSLTGNGLKGSMVMGPYDLFDGGEKFDFVLVDEAHRLSQRKNLTSYGPFDEHAKEIGKSKYEATQLDMIVARSKYRVLVYDKEQTVKGSDISDAQFEKAIKDAHVLRCSLRTQMRCKGGERFTDYLDAIFSCRQDKKLDFDPAEYDFRLFDDVERMVSAIKTNDKAMGLCRCAAGYAWEWVSKPYIRKGYDYIVSHSLQDIHIDGHSYVWNMTNEEFILSKNAVNEIGCIHTLQGYDLNYVGLIFGEEIDYDPVSNGITIDKSRFYDKKVKADVDESTLKRYIINSYKVMMSRGIKGCYVYACKPRLREYLGRFIGR